MKMENYEHHIRQERRVRFRVDLWNAKYECDPLLYESLTLECAIKDVPGFLLAKIGSAKSEGHTKVYSSGRLMRHFPTLRTK